MNIVNRIDQYNINNVFFCEAIKNKCDHTILQKRHRLNVLPDHLITNVNLTACDKYSGKSSQKSKSNSSC